jgi:predicted dehydrogenase
MTALRVALAGAGGAAQDWVRALRSNEGVLVQRYPAHSDDDLIDILGEETDAVVIIAPRDLALARRALVARKHVMLAECRTLDSRQLLALDDLARGRDLLFVVDSGGFADPAIAYVRRFVRSEHPLRRPLMIRVSVSGKASTFDTTLHDAVGRVLALASALPERIQALAAHEPDDPNHGAETATIALGFPDGLIGRIDIDACGLVSRNDTVVTCAGLAAIIDGVSGSVRTITASRRDGDAGLLREHFRSGDGRRPDERTAEVFVRAIADGQRVSNAREAAQAQLVCEAVHASIRQGGDTTTLPVNHPLIGTARPSLQVIVGGGHTTEAAAPRLRLVQAGRRAVPEEPPDLIA